MSVDTEPSRRFKPFRVVFVAVVYVVIAFSLPVIFFWHSMWPFSSIAQSVQTIFWGGVFVLLVSLCGPGVLVIIGLNALYDYLWDKEQYCSTWSSSKYVNKSTVSKSSTYGDHWEELARSIRKRDKYACRMCGARHVDLHVHHLVGRAQGGQDTPENLVTLCRSCHVNIHPHMRNR